MTKPAKPWIGAISLSGKFGNRRLGSPGMPDVDMRMPLRMILAMGVRFLLHLDRDSHEPAMPHAPLGDDMFGEMTNFARSPTQQRDFHAAGVVEMNLQGGDRKIMMIVMRVGETLGELPNGVVIDIDQRGDAIAGAARLNSGLLHAGAGEVANGLRPILIAAPGHEAVQFRDKLVVESDGDPLHQTRILQIRA